MTPHYGIISFYRIGGNMLYQKEYKSLYGRDKIIKEFSCRANVAYYQINPFANYWSSHLMQDKENEFVRPPAKYDNDNRSLYSK